MVPPLPTFVGTFYNLGGPIYCTLLHPSFANVSHCLQGGKNKNFILTFAKNTAWFYLYIFNMYNSVPCPKNIFVRKYGTTTTP
jgi:hypothetical protein